MALTEIKTSGIADDAVTTDKLANAINTERTANTAKVSTTINNNADNRVITGSGTANTLEGEANLTFNGSDLAVGAGNFNVSKAALPTVLVQNSTDTSFSTVKLQQSSGSGGYFAVNKLGTNSTATGGANAAQLWQSGNAPIIFGVNNAERMRMLPGGGLTFNGDTAAANALDDYEEGSWTPSVSNGLTNTQTFDATGKYIKIGKYVHCRFLLQFSGSGDGNLAKFGGLPFQSVNDSARGGGWCLWTNIPGLQDGDSIVLIVEQYATSVACYKDMNQNASTGSGGFTNKAFYGEFSYEAVS